MKNDIILTGPPRSGTTLACHLLNKIADTVALHEPMNIQMFPNREAGLLAVRLFFPEMRKSIQEKGEALSKVTDGKIPSNPFGNKGENGRPSIVKKGVIRIDKKLSADFKLIIKHNAHFTFLLPELQNYFPVYILIRNPVATLASWNSIKAPVSEGNLTVLQTLNPVLFEAQKLIPDRIDRQVQLLDKMYQSYIKATKAIIIRYEDIILSGGRILSSICADAKNMDEHLENKNTNPLYDDSLTQKIKTSLLRRKGAYLDFYPPESFENF